MTQPDKFTAHMLVASAAGFASAAASRLLENYPEVEEHFAPGGWSAWKNHYIQRIHELAAAVSSGVPEVFAGRTAWVLQTFASREVPAEDLRISLECLREVLDSELPDPARAAVGPPLALAVSVLEQGPGDEGPAIDGKTRRGRIALEYLVSALEGDSRSAIEKVLKAVDDGMALTEVYTGILLPVQKELGRMWQAGELSIAQEHLVTSTTQRLTAVLSFRGQAPEPRGLKALVAGVSGDVHDTALRAFSNLLEAEGWQVICLGCDVPDTEIAAAADYFGVDLMMLSATLPQHLQAVEKTIMAVKALEGRRIPVMVGGLAYLGTGDLWQRQGADGHAGSFEEALELAVRLAEPSDA
jgi:methanogenic corrinoid protein MtbC1